MIPSPFSWGNHCSVHVNKYLNLYLVLVFTFYTLYYIMSLNVT
ncbi:Uncharacterised protein [Staphylococcus intermedius NCTC 11048]|uniref:Uncharacterized protein n=1 Tax=Staphylococcus intermedius NCTC 11048 TaxID=1141106 RepID=A0A380G651_STAIN|nr:Uncharacterised protein [Staphylococcus intermedius NCTC 11048]